MMKPDDLVSARLWLLAIDREPTPDGRREALAGAFEYMRTRSQLARLARALAVKQINDGRCRWCGEADGHLDDGCAVNDILRLTSVCPTSTEAGPLKSQKPSEKKP